MVLYQLMVVALQLTAVVVVYAPPPPSGAKNNTWQGVMSHQLEVDVVAK